MEKRQYFDKPTLPPIHIQVATYPKYRPTLPVLDGAFVTGSPEEIHSKKRFVKLMRKCWSHHPGERPEFVEIVQLLEQNIRDYCDKVVSSSSEDDGDEDDKKNASGGRRRSRFSELNEDDDEKSDDK